MKQDFKVEINGLTYTIKEVDTIEEIDGKKVIGLTKYIEQEILLLKIISDELKAVTLKHELTHAFLWAYGFGAMEELPIEIVCDFVAIYSKKIDNICGMYFEEHKDYLKAKNKDEIKLCN